MANQITIIGMGAQGTAIARAVREHIPSFMITVCDADASLRARAQAQGFAHHVTGNLIAAAQKSDITILAAPLEDYAVLAREVGPGLKAGSLFMDTSPAKHKPLAEILPWIPESVAFVSADPFLIQDGEGGVMIGPGAGCILTPHANTPVRAIESATQFWERLGFQIDIMNADVHDAAIAMARQIPALLAAAQMFSSLGETQKSGVMDVFSCAGEALPLSFLRSMDPQYWRAAIMANRQEVEKHLGEVIEALAAMEKALRRGDADFLLAVFNDARDAARGPGWGDKNARRD